MDIFKYKIDNIKSLCGYNKTISRILTKNNTRNVWIKGVEYDFNSLSTKIGDIFDRDETYLWTREDLIFLNGLFIEFVEMISDDSIYDEKNHPAFAAELKDFVHSILT